MKYTLLKAQDPEDAEPRDGRALARRYWSGIETPDKYTVVLSSDVPRPGAFDSILYLRILDKDTTEGPDAATTMNGTGPFKFVEWVVGRSHHAWPRIPTTGSRACRISTK